MQLWRFIFCYNFQGFFSCLCDLKFFVGRFLFVIFLSDTCVDGVTVMF